MNKKMIVALSVAAALSLGGMVACGAKDETTPTPSEEEPTFTVTYDKGDNGVTGTVPTDTTAYKTGDKVTLKAAGDLSYEGRHFNGWTVTGSDAKYDAAAEFTMGEANVTFIASWAEHALEWKSDDEKHWQECSCSFTTEKQNHIDLINNETKAETPDGKCDECGEEVCNVTLRYTPSYGGDVIKTVKKGGKLSEPSSSMKGYEVTECRTYDDAWQYSSYDFDGEVTSDFTLLITLKQNLELLTADEYVGSTYVIGKNYDGEYDFADSWGDIGNNGLYVTDATDNSYIVNKETGTDDDGNPVYSKYALKFAGGDIEMYDKDSRLVDTLKAYRVTTHDLTVTGSAITINKADFDAKGGYWFKIPQDKTGFYNIQITDATNKVNAKYGKEDNATKPKHNDGIITNDIDGDIYLETTETDTTFVEFYVDDVNNIPESFTVTFTTVTPHGISAADPVIVTDGVAVINNPIKGMTYYVKATGEAQSSYIAGVLYGDGTETYNTIYYRLNGVDSGYKNWEWINGVSQENRFASVTLDASSTEILVEIPFTESDNSTAINTKKLTVTVQKDERATATEVTFTESADGTNKVLTSNNVTADGTYKLNDFGGAVVITSDTAFNVTPLGDAAITAESSGGKYSVTLQGTGVQRYFKLQGGSNYAVKQTFALGSKGNPVTITLTGDTATVTLDGSTNRQPSYKYYTVDAGTYKVSYDETDWFANNQLFVNDIMKGSGSVITIETGDVIKFSTESENDQTLTLTKMQPLFTEGQVGTYKGTAGADAVTLIIDDVYSVRYGFDDFGGATSVTVTKADDTYTIVNGDPDNQITFTIAGDVITVSDSSVSGSFTLTKEEQATLSAGTYTNTVNPEITLVISTDLTGSFYFFDNVSFVENGGVYSILDVNDTSTPLATFTVNDDGSLSVTDDVDFDTSDPVTFTKQA